MPDCPCAPTGHGPPVSSSRGVPKEEYPHPGAGSHPPLCLGTCWGLILSLSQDPSQLHAVAHRGGAE